MMRAPLSTPWLPTLLGSVLTLAMGAWTSTASAHIDVELSRYGGTDNKVAPCGKSGGTRGTTVHTFKPGSVINISLTETIPHPGYFRIAFDNDGDDDFLTPSGTDGVNGNCSGDAKCGPGLDDYCNNDTVLLDNLDAHAAGALNTKYTWSVTLPNIECDNCTLQVLQMMNDFNFHPQPYPADDIYYACIDLVLSNSAAETGDTPVTNDGIDCKGDGGGAGTSGSTAGIGGAGVGAAGTGVAGTGGGAAGVGGGTGGDDPVMSGTAGSGAGTAATAGTTATGGVAGVGATAGTGAESSDAGGDDGGSCAVHGPGTQRRPDLLVLLVMLGGALILRRRR